MIEFKSCPFCDKPFQIVGEDDWGWSYFHYSDCIMQKEFETGYVWHDINHLIDAINRREVCEWKFEVCGYVFGAPTGLYYTSCGRNYGDFHEPGKFCQNCGKPIKIT